MTYTVLLCVHSLSVHGPLIAWIYFLQSKYLRLVYNISQLLNFTYSNIIMVCVHECAVWKCALIINISSVDDHFSNHFMKQWFLWMVKFRPMLVIYWKMILFWYCSDPLEVMKRLWLHHLHVTMQQFVLYVVLEKFHVGVISEFLMSTVYLSACFITSDQFWWGIMD